VRACEGERAAFALERLLVVRRVGDVLADAFVAASSQVDDGGEAGELARDLTAQALELVALDLERKIADAVVRAHGRNRTRSRNVV
jgi:hypothetical protein